MNYRLLLFVLVLVSACKTTSVSTDLTTAYIGTYTRAEGHVNGQAEGIYRVGLNQRTGEVTSPVTVATTTNPSFLRLSANKQYLYAVSELAHADEPTGFIHAFRVGENQLRELNKLPTNGKAPCHVEIDNTGKFVIASNYVGGVATMYRIGNDGMLEEASKFIVAEELKQGKSSWLHSANISPDNKLVAIADKGMDRVWLFKLDLRAGELTPMSAPWVMFEEGDGPRHASWSADGRFLYVINELSNTVKVVAYNRTANTFEIVQTISTLPDGYAETSYCADLHLHPNGRFLYGSNRGHNSIAAFAVDKATGLLTALGQESTRGEFPRNFSIDARGNFLYAANQNSNNVTVYRIGADGKLTFTKQDFTVKTPVCIEW